MTKETYNLESVTENAASVGSLITGGLPTATATRILTQLSVLIQFLDHVSVKFTSPLINEILKILRKLLKHFKSIITLTFLRHHYVIYFL